MNKFKEILSDWNISSLEIHPLRGGLVSEKWLVRTPTSNLVLRDTGTNLKYTEAQIILLDHLSQSNFPYSTPELRSTKRNTKHASCEGHYFYMYEFIEGFPLTNQPDSCTSYNLGRLVGEYSKSVSIVDLPKDSTFVHMLEKDTPNILLNLIQNSPHLEKSLENLVSPLKEIYARDYKGLWDLDCIPCHLDYNPYNILTTALIRPTALIDFGSIAMKPKICDVSNAIKNVWGIYGECADYLIKPFFEGYLESQNLSNLEGSFIYPLLVDELVRSICWHTRRIDNNTKREEGFLKKRIMILDSLIQMPRDFSISI